MNRERTLPSSGKSPGCIAEGDDAAEAYARLEEAAESWIEAALEMGQEIPRPINDETFSGRVLLRLPRSVHRKAARAAECDGTSLNQYIVIALVEQLGIARASAGVTRSRPETARVDRISRTSTRNGRAQQNK